MASVKLLRETVLDIYRELYANATPKADFDELVKNAIIDSEGRRVIPFMDYEIDSDLMENIIDKHCKKHRFNKHVTNQVKIEVYLGCSPTSKRKRENSNNNTDNNDEEDNK